jgi:hypothetical protein
MFLALALMSAMIQPADPIIDVDVASGTGLRLVSNGVDLVRGSWFQYYAPGWTRGYYSQFYNRQLIDRPAPNVHRMRFESALVVGESRFTREQGTLSVKHRFGWKREEPAKVELCVAQLWVPAFLKGDVHFQGPVRRTLAQTPVGKESADERTLTDPTTLYKLSGPWGELEIRSSIPLRLFDARNYDQDFAEGKQLLWLGNSDLDVSKEKPAEVEVTFSVKPRSLPLPGTSQLKANWQPTPAALAPDETIAPLIPRPKTARLNYQKLVEVTGRYTFPAGRVRFLNDFENGVARRFQRVMVNPKSATVALDAGEAKLGIPSGGYRITISDRAISVIGQEQEGLRNGMRRLAQLVFLKNGRLWLPTGTVLDEPAVSWRGVHLFVGPSAVQFHRRLWDRVLSPLMLNKVVLQCERTDWESAPGLATDMTMSRADLVRLFQQYRNLDVEPIPLIQSFGHMEWFFANGKNRDVVFNPEIPYAVDPRKPEANRRLFAIWREAVRLLKPRVAHFGLDEIDMLGWPEGDHELVTTLWQQQLAELSALAKELQVEPMLWGDQALGPGEAPDAAHGDTKEHAARRRAAIPKGAWIADWHYRADPNPEVFLPPLRIWKNEGFRPIASAWYRPENIRGFALAADRVGAGFLQTTWAGYESNEANMIRELKQFTAMVLAAEYAWSARPELPDQLGYDPAEVFRRMYFDPPSPRQPVPGVRLSADGSIAFRSLLDPALVSAPATVRLPVGRKAPQIRVNFSTGVIGDEGESLGELTAEMEGGAVVRLPIRYGAHVRATEDRRATGLAARSGAISTVVLPVSGKVRSLTIRSTSPTLGLVCHGVTLVGG